LAVWREEPSERLDDLLEALTADDLVGVHVALLHCGQAPPRHADRPRAAGGAATEFTSYWPTLTRQETE
jgi:hypothetical protein